VYQDESSDELSDVIDSLLVPSRDVSDDELETIHSFIEGGDGEEEEGEDEKGEESDEVVEVNQSGTEIYASDMDTD
jgi:hypothetical protein